jgi:RimJ/RimL family protein N-acetyltransferase
MRQLERAPEILTDRLCLRALAAEDFDAYGALRSDPRTLPRGGPESREQLWTRVLRAAGHWALLGFGYWAVVERGSGLLVGETGFADYRRDVTPSLEGSAEAGWMIAADCHGRGYAGEAVAAMLAWAAGNIPLERATCMIDVGNAASVAVARRAGFTPFAEASYNEVPVILFERPLRSGS